MTASQMILCGFCWGMATVMLVWAFYIVDQNARQRQPSVSLRKVPPIRDNGMFKAGRSSVKPAKPPMTLDELAREFVPAYEPAAVATGSTRRSVKDDFVL
jgi:hypothetical protein